MIGILIGVREREALDEAYQCVCVKLDKRLCLEMISCSINGWKCCSSKIISNKIINSKIINNMIINSMRINSMRINSTIIDSTSSRLL